MGSPWRKKHRAMAALPPARSARIGTAKRVKELIHGAEHQSAGGEREPLAPDDIRQIDDNNGVPRTPPVVDTNEVPEGRRPLGVLEKHFRAHARAGAPMDRWERRARGHAEGLEPPFRRL